MQGRGAQATCCANRLSDAFARAHSESYVMAARRKRAMRPIFDLAPLSISLQDRLDLERLRQPVGDACDVTARAASSDDDAHFCMSGLFDEIPGNDYSSLPIRATRDSH